MEATLTDHLEQQPPKLVAGLNENQEASTSNQVESELLDGTILQQKLSLGESLHILLSCYTSIKTLI